MERTYTVMLVEDERNILYGMKNAILCYKPQVYDIMTCLLYTSPSPRDS